MQLKINCPGCNSESTFFFIELDYQGPFRCWKCKNTYSVKVIGGKLEACAPMTADEYSKLRGRASY